ncbi:MAG: DNA repair protein RecN [Treponema sp.]|jgi:DNA repair protein RecN (Recombination protein N)|nr:DNA repair protein RecN [Treponema sp.]
MLNELVIRNFALIDSLSVSFEDGLNILTGETGAGKSIIVGALSFLLGGKADADVIRTGAEEASVSAVMRVKPGNADVSSWLNERGIELDDENLIIRRTLKTNGRGNIYIQNVPVTRNDLADFTAFLFDLHGQHNHETLLKKESHRRYLDRFAGLEDETAAFNEIFIKLTESRKTMESSLANERDREARLELLQYAVEEINQVNPKIGESRELESEAARLSDFEKLAGQVTQVSSALFDDESSIVSLLRKTKSSLENAASIDTNLTVISQRIDALFYEAEDISEEFRSYQDKLTYDPQRLEEVEERLALLYRLKKKYGADEEAVIAYKNSAEAEIETLSQSEESREKIKAEIKVLEKNMLERAGIISKKRKDAAEILGTKISEILGGLGMPKARFSVSVAGKGMGPNGLICGPWGADDVEFLISANAGEPLKELSKIASGGELARVMLAIKTVLAGVDTIETLIFDEIDTGIGGEVALAVGDYMLKIGKIKQLFCVTHLASIAVRADNHLKVEKHSDGQRTVTTVSVLSDIARVQEIARMLAGDSAGSAALAHAEDLLAKYGRGSAERGA